jgi:tyrosine-protein phosphatase YwqE
MKDKLSFETGDEITIKDEETGKWSNTYIVTDIQGSYILMDYKTHHLNYHEELLQELFDYGLLRYNPVVRLDFDIY